MMKSLVLICAMCFSVTTYAGYDCETSEGDLLTVAFHWRKGASATLESKSVTDYYQNNLGFEIEVLESFIDPETKKYATENLSNGYIFALGMPIPTNGKIWSLELVFLDKLKATASLIDMEGVEFNLDLVCQQTPDLE